MLKLRVPQRRFRALRLAVRLGGDERGQMALGFAILVMGLVALFGVSFDTGAWYFEHRTIQNAVEAAALAAAEQLPATDTSAATSAAQAVLTSNGVALSDMSCLQFSSSQGTSSMDTVKVCASRDAPGIFSALSSISGATVSASAIAMAGPVNGSNVMPWAIVPPDPTCQPGETCYYDANGNGSYSDPGDCAANFSVCPWGLTTNRLYVFKSGGGGNTGVIDSCGNGTSNYKACLNGSQSSGFYQTGSTVDVGLQGGNLGTNTNSGLNGRSPATAWDPGTGCDVASYPYGPNTSSPGYDPVGSANAESFYPNATNGCQYRIVSIPILASLPPNGGGSASLTVLGVASFAVAGWNRTNNKDAYGTSSSACAVGGSQTNAYDCGMVWGYLLGSVRAPGFLVEKISPGSNPLAPIMVALTG